MDPFDEYRFFAESTQRLADRRSSATQAFITVNTIVFTALSLTRTGAPEASWVRLLLGLALVGVGVGACVLWHRLILSYKALIDWRFSQLMAMEATEAFTGSHRFFTREHAHFYADGARDRPFGFSRVEVRLPQLFGAAYVVVGASIVVTAIVQGAP